MPNRRLITACFCFALALAVIPSGLGSGFNHDVSASALHRVSLPAVQRIFPIPTATPTATRTPRPTRTPVPSYLTIQNDLDCILSLQLDQVGGSAHYEWNIPAGTTESYVFTPGAYDWYASSWCCGSGSGNKHLTDGYVWRFFCVSGFPDLRQQPAD